MTHKKAMERALALYGLEMRDNYQKDDVIRLIKAKRKRLIIAKLWCASFPFILKAMTVKNAKMTKVKGI